MLHNLTELTGPYCLCSKHRTHLRIGIIITLALRLSFSRDLPKKGFDKRRFQTVVSLSILNGLA